jgi:hypothetical protein
VAGDRVHLGVLIACEYIAQAFYSLQALVFFLRLTVQLFTFCGYDH